MYETEIRQLDYKNTFTPQISFQKSNFVNYRFTTLFIPIKFIKVIAFSLLSEIICAHILQSPKHFMDGTSSVSIRTL